MNPNDRTALAIDPGSSKCGLALVHRESDSKLELIWRAVVPTDLLLDKTKEAMTVRPFTLEIVGAGTSSRSLVHQLRDAMPSMGILVVDEKDTSMQARERYWEHNPRRGLQRLLPATMSVPKEPIDDFAALVLAERVLLP